MSGLFPFTPAASQHAGHIDLLIGAFSLLVLLLAGPVFILIFAFAIRYRRGKKVDRSLNQGRNVWLEVSWSVIPFLLILAFFAIAARIYIHLREPPAGALPVSVVARQWMWKFQHPQGQAEINMLHVPTGQPIRLTMTSQDVIHSLYIPALRIKQDVLPGRYTDLWFTADRPGTYHLFCAEFCGTDHAVMGGSFVAMPPGDYATWLAGQTSNASLAVQGGTLYARLGCGACHGGGAAVRAPSLKGLYGATVTLTDGQSVRADDQYLRDAILEPNKQQVAGYPPIMPTYRGVVDEAQAMALVAWLRTQRQVPEGQGR